MRKPTAKTTKTPSDKKLRTTAATVFAVAGIAVCIWTWQHYRRIYSTPKSPIPILEMIPTVPKEKQETIRNIVGGATKMMLFLSPEQQKQTREIWKEPPRSLDDLIAKQQQMDAILTPQQRARAKPIRTLAQNRIVDEMFEQARDRFRPDDFNAMKDEIKRRVEKRMSGQ